MDGEIEYLFGSKNSESSNLFSKIISYEDGQIFGYYFNFPHSINIPEKSKVSANDMAKCFVNWWDSIDDTTFFNPDFWRSVSWAEKEREWKSEVLGDENVK